jgi:transcriptional regulator with PAS, ATPase and Fis domain
LGGLVAIDPTMLATLDLVDRAARTPAPVLLEGESGVGKELLARRLHEKSTVADRPFLAVNAAALPDTLLESELFGHKKGAFTGADRDRDGLFVAARGGTVFLDEVASMSPSFQGKLLRVLQERVVRPLGGTEDRRVEFRLVSASNKDLATLAAEGRFRDDLFYRLGVVVVKVPALRERPLDVEPLARRFLAEAAATCLAPSAPPPRLSQDALAALRAHRFPGNVRELRNAMQRAVVLVGDGPVEPSHLGLDLGATSKGLAQASGSLDYEEAKRRAVESFQREFVRRALSATNGNVSQAAERCGMTRAALQRILRRLDVDRADFDESS